MTVKTIKRVHAIIPQFIFETIGMHNQNLDHRGLQSKRYSIGTTHICRGSLTIIIGAKRKLVVARKLLTRNRFIRLLNFLSI